ncbi:MAG TPA: hypothetical protein VN524_10450 [Hyphomicrobiaceae bacterium]|nr:hypothetical protein [Hyphomicrobiaceae bacterium]
MKSQLRFVMHPNDESSLVARLLHDPTVLLVDGPRWKTATPPTTRNLSAVGWSVIIWSPEDLAELPAEFIAARNDWYCRGEYATIQFLRSQVTGTMITEGRFAISTELAQKTTAANVECRYRLLRRAVQRTYTSSVVRWRNPRLPGTTGKPSTPASPSKPDRSLWVGPAAMAWLAADPARRIKQDPTFVVEGMIGGASFGASH